MTFKEFLTSIADSIRSGLGTDEKYKPSGFPLLIKKVKAVSDSKSENLCDLYSSVSDRTALSGHSLYDDLWNAFQQNSGRRDYIGMISVNSVNTPNPGSFAAWKSKYIFPKYKPKPSDAYGMFAFCQNLVSPPEVDFTQLTGTMNSCFFKCAELSEVGSIVTNSKKFEYVFLSCPKLRKIASIDAPVVNSWQKSFQGCYELESISFARPIKASIDFQNCTKLDAHSLSNIIERLDSEVYGKTVSFSANSKLVYDGSYGSGAWDNALLSKGNWTIALI